jgi:acyl dehydratase
MEPLIPKEALELIGKETVTELGQLTPVDCMRFALAVGDMNPLYFDEPKAKGSAYEGLIAHPNLLTAITTWGVGATEETMRPDGTGGARPESLSRSPTFPGLPRVMGAGQELEFLVPVRPGDSFRRVSKITDIKEAEGSTGKMVITITEQRYINQREEVAVICRSTSIAR